ncbi:MAG: polymerase, sigma-24 subunit, subfamily [Pseudonocardiales bacterium]|nr:polymerase, sigma-24 subunit, subfamily [Pseudonocardiales bacterium]
MSSAVTAASTDELEEHRVALTGYAYRMLGSAADADDAVQEAMIRAWRSRERFAGRSSLRTWMYRITTNVCIDMLNGRRARAFPIDLAPSSPSLEAMGSPAPRESWIEPVLDSRVLPGSDDPAEMTVARETIRLAFVAALQHLPPKQRAVLILRDVLRWKASEVAELLDASEVSVNSALQRARAKLSEQDLAAAGPDLNDELQALLGRYVEYFERYDIESLVSLLHEDATQTMPPWPLRLLGSDEIATWLLGPGNGCRGSRLLPLQVNGSPGFAQYRRSPDGGYEPFSIQVLEIVDGRIQALNHFVEPQLFAEFGLPHNPG